MLQIEDVFKNKAAVQGSQRKMVHVVMKETWMGSNVLELSQLQRRSSHGLRQLPYSIRILSCTPFF